MAAVVMVGVMLGLSRVGGGSGWRQCQATEVGSREEGEREAAWVAVGAIGRFRTPGRDT